MDKQEIYKIRTMINEFGARDTLRGFITALQQSADEMSDMGLKERAIDQADMAALLQWIDKLIDNAISE